MKLYDCLVAEECREKYKNAENSKHMNVFFFFFFLRNQTKGFRVLSNAMRKWLVTFFYFLLHVILTCFLYVPHRRIPLQSSNSLSLSEFLSSEKRTLLVLSSLCQGFVVAGWYFFYILLTGRWVCHFLLGCHIGPDCMIFGSLHN